MSTNGANGNSANGMNGKPPVDRALELLVYGPVGFTLMAWQAMPKLVNEIVNRSCAQITEAETKVRQARMIGQVAVNVGPKLIRREVDSRLADALRRAGELACHLPGVGRDAPGPSVPAQAAAPEAAVPDADAPPPNPFPPAPAERTTPSKPGRGPAAAKARPKRTPSKPTTGTSAAGKTATAAPAVTDLPITAYDGLSASQVVSRLNGLTPAELDAVRAYESAGRARKTILVAVDRLLP